MSQYSEMMGSFIRTGDYPMEANYIFNSEEELRAFYADEINNTTLHKGLLKIVSSEDSQTLYWVVKVEGELQFKPLIQEGSIDKLFDRLAQIRNDLNQEISDRGGSILEIVGTDDMSEFQNQLDNLLAISNAVVDLQKQSTEHSDILSAVVGTEEENVLEYLKSLDYNSLSDISKLLHKFFDTIDTSESQINTLPELQEFLKGFDYNYNLYQYLKDLQEEIQGTPAPTTTFKTLRGIQDFVETLASISNNRDNNLQIELDQTQAGVGLSGDGSFNPDQETNYLKSATSVMNALKTLDSLIAKTLRTFELVSTETNTVSITIEEGATNSNISADVKISNEGDIIVNDGGLYTKLSTEYEDGILTIKVNGNIRSQHHLAISSILDSAYYDQESESLILNFQNSPQITIPVSDLIEEWTVNNPEDTVVELARERITSGVDKLSADVRLDSSDYNILKKVGNSLSVDGRSSNIIHDEQPLSEVLEDLGSNVLDIQSSLEAEIQRAQSSEQSLQSQINAISKEPADLSGRVNALEESMTNVTEQITGINDILSELTEWYEG